MQDPLAVMVTGYGAPFNCHEAKPRWWNSEDFESAVGLGPDAFHVDDLLEYSNEVIGGPIGGVQASGQSVQSSVTVSETVSHQPIVKAKQQPPKLPDEEHHSKELGLDYHEIAELDWLSNFVEESYSTREDTGYMSKELLSMATVKHQPGRRIPHAISESSMTSEGETSLSCKVPVPGRARSKRRKAGNRAWSSSVLASASDVQGLMEAQTSVQDMPIFAESFLSFDYSTLSADSEFILPPEESSGIRSVNKYFKACKGKKLGQNVLSLRRCTHCLSQHTPQWRAGPAGPKTLCNACGVRYKSGRLLPEYRPAGSPTFMAHVHSNSHRKVLEMRKLKDGTEVPHQDETKFNPKPNDSFMK